MLFRSSFIIVTFGQLSAVRSETLSPPDKALAYIENVLPIDMGYYTIMNMSYYELPEPANSTYRTEAVGYILKSSGSLLAVNCMFRNGVQYTCDLRVLSGSLISDKSSTNLVDVTKNILERHQVQTGVDSTELIRMLDMVDPTKNFETVTLGNVTLTVSHGKLPTSLKMVNGSLHIDPTTVESITSFNWMRMVEGANNTFVFVDFENGVFHSLRDERPLTEPVIIPSSEGDSTILAEEPFPTAIVAVASASMAVVGVGLTVYFKRRDHSANTGIDCDSAVV